MKNCFFVPRLFVPSKECDKWSVIACDRNLSDPSFWEREAAARGASPSALNLILPEARLKEIDEEEYSRIGEEMYAALENEWLEKLVRGLVLTKRKFSFGTRHGIVAAIDLECFASGGGDGQVRSLQAVSEELVGVYLKERQVSPIEMPHTIILYSDPKDKAVGALIKEDLEELYQFKTKNGHVKGYFIPEPEAEDTTDTLSARAQNYYVIEGVAAAEAAKLHWQNVKSYLTKGEMGRHPARFMLAEFLNLNDDAVELCPVHRLVKDTEAEAFCDFFTKNIKCTRKGTLLAPELPFGASAVQRIDALIAEFLKADGGRAEYIHSENRLKKCASEEGCAGILMPHPEKEKVIKELRDGGYYPAYSLCVGGEDGARYYVEAREISYD